MVTTVPASVTNVVLLAANVDRAPGALIVNNSNKNMWVSLTGAAATAAAPNSLIPPSGGLFDIPNNYTSAINAIWGANASPSTVVHQFLYV